MIEEPKLTLRRSERGRWNILDGVNGQADTDQQTMALMARTFMVRQAKLLNGTITVMDAARPDGIRSITLEHVECDLTIHPEQGVADVHVAMSHQGTHGVSRVSLDGAIKQAEQPVALSGDDVGNRFLDCNLTVILMPLISRCAMRPTFLAQGRFPIISKAR